MWQLKRKQVDVSIKNATVKQIVQAVAPGYELDCIDEVYGNFSMKQTTAVKVFNELQEKPGFTLSSEMADWCVVKYTRMKNCHKISLYLSTAKIL